MKDYLLSILLDALDNHSEYVAVLFRNKQINFIPYNNLQKFIKTINDVYNNELETRFMTMEETKIDSAVAIDEEDFTMQEILDALELNNFRNNN